MKDLKELVEDLFEYTQTISISESELYSNYYDKINKTYADFEESKGKLNKLLDKMIKADILYDLIYDIDNIKSQLLYDTGVYDTDSQEYKDILIMYKKIKEIFKDFHIEILESGA